MHVLMENFRCDSLLPWRETALCVPRCFLEYTVPLDEMRSQDETESIERKYREIVAATNERKDAFSDLSNNEIVFEHRQAVIIYPTNTEIHCDVIQAFTRNGVMNIIELPTCPAGWPRVEINDVGVKWVND